MAFRSIVVLTGAGLSAESGLGTFRDKDGLWAQFDLAEVATPEGFARNPARVHDFYNLRRRRLGIARPNAAHARAGTAGASAWRSPHRHPEYRCDCTKRPARTSSSICMANWPVRSVRVAWRVCLGPRTFQPRRSARLAVMPARCGPTWCGSARCRARWTASTRRWRPATCSSRSAPAAASIRRPGFVAEARAAGAHTVELNLEPSEGASRFAEAAYGPATEIVPNYVEKLLRF